MIPGYKLVAVAEDADKKRMQQLSEKESLTLAEQEEAIKLTLARSVNATGAGSLSQRAS